MRRKKKKLDAAKEARRRARKAAPVPSTLRVIEDKRKKPSKHKRNFADDETV